MLKKIISVVIFCTFILPFAQKKKTSDSLALLKELSASSCECVDSISVYNKDREAVALEISNCINKSASVYQLGDKLSKVQNLEKSKNKDNKKINIEINTNENSTEYKKYYYELERYMMDNCTSLQKKINSNEKQTENSVSDNKLALEYYSRGQEASENEDYYKAKDFYEKAVKLDPKFAFAWDNLGIIYRKMNDYDKAIEMYNKSLQIDPTGKMPLQNIAVAYVYKKEYTKAIESYEKLALLDPKDPEVHYGLGNIYSNHLKEYEKALDHLCKAYNIYIDQKSPYRTDAEKQIGYLFQEMKKEGKEAKFDEILKANNIKR